MSTSIPPSQESLLKLYTPQFKTAVKMICALTASVWGTSWIPTRFIRGTFSFFLFFFYLAFNNLARKKVCKQMETVSISNVRSAWNANSIPAIGAITRFVTPKPSHIEVLKIPSRDGSNPPVRAVLLRHDDDSSICVDHPTLILHIHGGAMAPEDHMGYLCRWARSLPGVPILSIDYRLAPEHPFPAALDDCFSCYTWAVENYIDIQSPLIRKKMEDTTEELPLYIAVLGDSAGGNLSATLNMKIISEDYRQPDGVILIYPIMDFLWEHLEDPLPPSHSINKYTNDPIIPSRIRYLAKSNYLIHLDFSTIPPSLKEGFEEPKDPIWFHSPLRAPESVWNAFPKTFIHVGDKDPLYDDSLAVNDLLCRLGKDVTLHVFKDISHGYMNVGDIVPEGKTASKQTCQWLREILNIKAFICE